MPNPPSLSVSAFGTFQLLQNGIAAPKFKYLDSRELLVFLLLSLISEVSSGKSKQAIGAALWGDLANAQLNARFKARLNDVRQVLGGRDWILFEDETYKFNFARQVFFDVQEFVRACQEAERHHNAGTIEPESAALQRALALYRGDFMQDYHTRSRKDFYGEREWYFEVREELQAKYRHALERLAQIELNKGKYDSAVDLLRKLVASDDYDDRAHQQLMWTLSLQGRRSQALRHYHNLVKQRGDTSPDAELTTLFEKIKRNEPLGESKPHEPASARPTIANSPRIPPPFQVPSDLSRFVGREPQYERLREAIAPAHDSDPAELPAATDDRVGFSSVCLVGMGGIGKTSLAIHAAYRLREHFPDGVLWGNLRESEPLAILASWERAFGCDFSGLPDLNARAASLRSMLHDKKVLVLLDDVVDAAEARSLLLTGEHTRTVFTSRSAEIAVALDAVVIEMPVMDADESADLLTRIVGKARIAGQEQVALEICGLLGHLPLALDITARRLVSRPNWGLRDMADRLRVQMQRLDELQLADRAVRATFGLSWDVLTELQKHVLAHVGIFEARSFTAAALASVAEIEVRAAQDLLEGLISLSLLSFESSTRYRQHPLLADFSKEKLGERPQDPTREAPSAAVAAQRNLVEYYLQYATAHRREYLALEEEWDNLNVGIELANTQQAWQAVIDYGDVLTDAWFARGRFTDARRNYPFVMRAAREMEEQDPYISATLNWGKACIDQGDYVEAEGHLQHGLQTSREVNDEYGIGSALYLLGRVSVERSEYDAAQKYLEESQGIRKRIGDRSGVAETLYMRARIKYLFGKYDDARNLAWQSKNLYAELGVSRGYIIVLRLAAAIAGKIDRLSEAKGYIALAVEMAEALDDKSEYAAALNSEAILAWQLQEFETAGELARQAGQLLRIMGDRKGTQFVLELQSLVAVAREQFQMGLDFGLESLKFAREKEDKAAIVRLLSHIGDIYFKMGQLSSACQAWQEALPLALELGHPLANSLHRRMQDDCKSA